MKRFGVVPRRLENINENQILALDATDTSCSYLPSRLGKGEGIKMLVEIRDILKSARAEVDNGKKMSKVQVNEA